MKKFTFVIFVWFLFQLIFLSAATNFNSVRLNGETPQEMSADCWDGLSPTLAFIGGAMFPITAFNFVNGGFCWTITSNVGQ